MVCRELPLLWNDRPRAAPLSSPASEVAPVRREGGGSKKQWPRQPQLSVRVPGYLLRPAPGAVLGAGTALLFNRLSPPQRRVCGAAFFLIPAVDTSTRPSARPERHRRFPPPPSPHVAVATFDLQAATASPLPPLAGLDSADASCPLL